MDNWQNIPEELRNLDQWVLWRLEQKPGRDKPTKVPYTPSQVKASSTDPTTWSTFADVLEAVGEFDGLGFVFSEHDPFCGCDFDDPLTADKLATVQTLASYTERSPSGAGLHVIVRAKLPGPGRNDQVNGREIYDRARYFTMTGDIVDGAPATIEDRQTEVDAYYATFKQPDQVTPATDPAPVDVDDEELLQRMFASRGGAAIAKLWAGDISAHGDDASAADLALCNHLAFWTGADAGRMDRLFRQSGLMRPKWDQAARTGETYGAGTIRIAIEGTGNHYTAPGELPELVFPETTTTGAKLGRISERIDKDLRNWGYDLWLNDLDDSVWNGPDRLDDAARAQLRMRARDEGYAKLRLLTALDDAIIALAARRRRHPIRDYLSALTWDGVDHLSRLATYFDDRHEPLTLEDGRQETVFQAFMRRWLVGSVAKMMGDDAACRANFVLVLSTDQNAGKSHFANWLCPLPGYFVEQHIAPDNKDTSLRRCNSWVWEVSEIGATTRRADVEALKAHITAATVTERKAYGHFDTVKPAVASYIGTVNPDGAGFLTDTTGNRRFAVVDLVHINWLYAERVDIHQVWAQAFQLWQQSPKAYRFTDIESAAQNKNADNHVEPDIMADMLVRVFEIDPAKENWRETSSLVLDKLRTFAGMSRGNDKVQGKELARTLKKNWGIVGKRSNGATVYTGLQLLPTYQTDYNSTSSA